MGTTQYQYWLIQVSIFGKFPKMPHNMLKYWQILWPLSKFHLFPSLGTAMHLSVLQFGKFLLFPLNFGSLAVKTMAFFEISSFHKSSLTMLHTSIVVICMVTQIYYSPHILSNTKLILFPHSNFSIGLAQKLGCKCQGNYQNFDNFPSIICRLVHIVKPS